MKILQKITLVYIILLLLIAVLPINGKESGINHIYIVTIRLDYLLHALLFIPMLFLLSRAFSNMNILNILIGLCLAIMLESIQYLLPYRTFNINDLLANAFGVLLGMIFTLPIISGALSRFFHLNSQ